MKLLRTSHSAVGQGVQVLLTPDLRMKRKPYLPVLKNNNLKLRHPRCVRYNKMVQVVESKHNQYGSGVFIIKTICFGPCTGPSSGLKLCFRGDYRVHTPDIIYIRSL